MILLYSSNISIKSQHHNSNKITIISKVDKIINMLMHDFTGNSSIGKHYYIKRKMIKDESLIHNGSIFPSSSNHLILSLAINKYQTIRTNIEHTATLNSNNDEEFEASQRKFHADRIQILSIINTTSQTKFSKHSNGKSI